MRRFAALALATSLLHLNLVRADVACAKHDHAGALGHGAADHTMEHHGVIDAQVAHERDAAGLADREQSCETPSQPECCQALASCSPAFGADAESALSAHVLSHDVAQAGLIEIPPSRVPTPDPPPPKA
jgi:hypothetical protein